MNARELLTDLAHRGVSVAANGDSLTIDAPAGLITPELRQTIVERKGELIEILNSARAKDESCPICHGPLQEQKGKSFVHRWCLTPGHFDSWRAMYGLKLGETDAPIFGKMRQSRDLAILSQPVEREAKSGQKP